MTEHKYTNSLIHETSPYLLQHAHNPVNWYAWNREALELAQQQDKPILLSIGYSACHWCHVMEHESFEDEDVADYMNQHFVCVKVDREERPDLDKIYQIAHQMLTQRPGGWPLNVALAADTHVPFFAGTYFPKTPRHGMPSFQEVLKRVVQYYRTNRKELEDHATAITNAFRQTEPTQDSEVNPGVLDIAVKELTDNYDPVYGGFGNAPKFPYPTGIELCMHAGASKRVEKPANPRALHIAQHTLKAMAEGGLFDQLGGGFCRYSVDAEWSIPHFEKMLYDNAQLLSLYVDAWQATRDDIYKDIALSTGEWVIREMQSSSGGYYSTLDADSEGEEGKFYVWTLEQLRETLSEQEYAILEVRFGLRGQPNFEGKWHFNITASLQTVAQRCGIDAQLAKELLETAKQKLFDKRATRPRPGRDEKILTSWNALMIKGMARAGHLMERSNFTQSAERALAYVEQDLWQQNRLLATAKDGNAHLNAYLDDYVFLIDAILELNQARWRTSEIEFAIELADIVLKHFEDKNNGGYFFTSDDHEKLLHRSKPTSDDATPSGNGIAAKVLARLGHLLGESRYLQSAERTLRLLSFNVMRYPSAHGALVMSMEEFLYPPDLIIIRGHLERALEWLTPIKGGYLPHTMIFLVPTEEKNLPGILSNFKCGQEVTAYICNGTSCTPPINDIDQFINTFRERKSNA